MPVSVRIPTPLRKLTNNQEVVQAEGATIGAVIDSLDETFPGLRERILNEAGDIRPFVNVYLNDEDVRFLEEKSSAVKTGDEISIVPAIAGG